MNVQNKTIIVTGAGNGIGRALVLNLLEKEAQVIGLDINLNYLKETAELTKDKNNNFQYFQVDISNQEEIENFYNTLQEKNIMVDGLINNAGIIQPFIKTEYLDYALINKIMSVNFYGPLYLIKTFLPQLSKQKEAHIVNISSMGGFLPVPGQTIYGASKAGLKLLTEGLYAELLDTNVKVTIVFPGAIGTDIAKNSNVKQKSISKEGESKNHKSLPADQAAEIIINGMLKNKFQIFVGQDSKFLNFLYRLCPSFAVRFISKQMKSLLSD